MQAISVKTRSRGKQLAWLCPNGKKKEMLIIFGNKDSLFLQKLNYSFKMNHAPPEDDSTKSEKGISYYNGTSLSSLHEKSKTGVH